MHYRTRRKTIYILTLFGIFVWLAAIFLAPFLRSRESAWGIFCYSVFSPVCHQIPGRCLTFFDYPLAVCARCFGIYAGFFLGTLAFPVMKKHLFIGLPKPALFLAVSAPIVIDTVGNFFNLWPTPNILRFFIGMSWGWILPVYFLNGLFSAFAENRG